MRSALWLATLVSTVLTGCQDSFVSRSIGARCDGTRECDERCLLESAGYPGGFCTIACEDSLDCTTRTACIDLEGGVCLFECSIPADCTSLGDGWDCIELPRRDRADVLVKVCSGV